MASFTCQRDAVAGWNVKLHAEEQISAVHSVNGVVGDHGEEARNLHNHYLGTV